MSRTDTAMAVGQESDGIIRRTAVFAFNTGVFVGAGWLAGACLALPGLVVALFLGPQYWRPYLFGIGLFGLTSGLRALGTARQEHFLRDLYAQRDGPDEARADADTESAVLDRDEWTQFKTDLVQSLLKLLLAMTYLTTLVSFMTVVYVAADGIAGVGLSLGFYVAETQLLYRFGRGIVSGVLDVVFYLTIDGSGRRIRVADLPFVGMQSL